MKKDFVIGNDRGISGRQTFGKKIKIKGNNEVSNDSRMKGGEPQGQGNQKPRAYRNNDFQKSLKKFCLNKSVGHREYYTPVNYCQASQMIL